MATLLIEPEVEHIEIGQRLKCTGCCPIAFVRFTNQQRRLRRSEHIVRYIERFQLYQINYRLGKRREPIPGQIEMSQACHLLEIRRQIPNFVPAQVQMND